MQLKPTLLAAALSTALFAPGAFAALPSTALPAGATVTNGNAFVSQGSNNTLLVSATGNSVITYSGGFNVGSAAAVQFNNSAPGSEATVLNVDTSGQASEIDGAVKSNGVNLFIANQNGMIIGNGATITAPGQTLGLLAQQVNASQFASGGSFTYGSGNSTTLTIESGATISGQDVFIAGAGTVNVGGFVNGVNGVHIDGGLPQNNNTLIFSQTYPTGGLARSGNYYDAAPSGAVKTQINLLANSAVSAQIVGFWNHGNVQGPGAIHADVLNAYIAGSFNNPNGGGSPTNSWYPNHITIDPFTAGKTVSVFGVLSGNAPSFWNLWVNGNADYYPNSLYSTPVSPAYGSHLTLQASGNLSIKALKGLANLFNNSTSQTLSGYLATFPGLVVATAGSAGNGSVNKTSTLELDADLSNMVTDGQPGSPTGAGLGIFLQAGQIVGAGGNTAPNLYINGNGSSWVNLAGTTPFGVNIYQYAAPNSTSQAPSSVIHYRTY